MRFRGDDAEPQHFATDPARARKQNACPRSSHKIVPAWGTPGSDIDGDGDTGITDVLALLAAWGACA